MGFPNARITNNSSGGEYIASTAQQNGNWQALQFLVDSKLHTLTGNVSGLANTNSASAPTLPAGFAIYGKFTSFQLHSGSAVLAYKN